MTDDSMECNDDTYSGWETTKAVTWQFHEDEAIQINNILLCGVTSTVRR